MSDVLQPDRCARLLKALADPERLRIVGLLRAGPRTVGEIAATLGLQPVNASHHLGVLRHAGLLQDERDGRFVRYQLNPTVFQPASQTSVPEFLDLGCCRLEMPRE